MTNPAMSMCACGHRETSHHITPSKRRTYCYAGGPEGNCKCKLFEPTPEVKRV